MNGAPRRRTTASDLVSLMLAVVPYLIAQSPVEVREVAQTFGQKEETIRDLVRTLYVTGIPGDTGVGLPDDLFDFDYVLFEEDDIIDMIGHVGPKRTPRFSGEEAAALIAGLRFMSGIVRESEQASVDRLIAKVARGSRNAPEAVTAKAIVLPAGGDIIDHALRERTQVRFTYLNATGAIETRTVDPYRLDLVDTVWYLRGYCHVREQRRTFRLDRMRDIVGLPDSIVTNYEPTDSLFDESADGSEMTVVVDIAESAVSLLSDYRAELTAPVHGVVRATLPVAHTAGLIRLVARVPGAVTVVSPPEAVAAVRAWALSGRDYFAI